MGFQMSVMCIGQLAMQTVVNSLGTAAVAGYTAASKADQLSVLVNNAMMTAISNSSVQASHCGTVSFGADGRDLLLLRCVPDHGGTLLFCSGTAGRLSDGGSEYGKWKSTVCCMHD